LIIESDKVILSDINGNVVNSVNFPKRVETL